MATIALYHNPRCSKSRQALAFLNASDQTFTVIEYLKQPLNAAQLHTLRQKCQCKAAALIRYNAADFKAAGLHHPKDLSDEDIIQAIANHPTLMQRPIVSTAKKAIIARPPEKALEIL
jgi:arsenate reductase (glutaredoxin)